jgi:hypothetical protein|tara:strand:+ start:127 stop:747 length:621 start_codon:yes stop_codon:yes gene_type:complete
MSIVTLNDRAVRSVTTFGSVSGGSMVFIKKLTASSDGTLSFVDGASDVVFDSTYKEYLFTFNNVHPATDAAALTFNGSDDDSSHSYDVTKTTSYFYAYQNEAGNSTNLVYDTGQDLAQATGFQNLAASIGSDNDQGLSGSLRIFNPSSTTFVKHFIGETHISSHEDLALHFYIGGYFNTTADITAIQFKMSSGNIDAGDICLYGIL